jgi:tetratricopeptide (TPR) repeat protein
MPAGDMFDVLRKLGPRYAPPAVGVLLCAGVIWYRWQLGYRDPREFAADSLLWSTAGIYVIVLSIYYYVYGLPWEFASTQVGILVAPIPGDNHRAQQNSYVNAIRSLVASDTTMDNVVKVRILKRELPEDPDQQHYKAIQLGRQLGATLVIRPVPTEGGHSPWVTVVDQPEFAREEAALGKVTKAQLAELETLPLPRDVTVLARCALALSYYRRKSYIDAASQLTEIIHGVPLPAAAPARSHLDFLLANCCWHARSGDPASFLAQAITAYDEALHGLTRDGYPTHWAMTMNNRGNAYAELPGPDRAANLQEAIRCYDAALTVYTSERYPTQWAITMNNRGNAYRELPGPDRAANLNEAIRSYDAALTVRTRERYPTQWAMTLNNRGIAYVELPGPDRAANLQEAIRSFDAALTVRTRERYPTEWAMTMNNRGTAYGKLTGPDRSANLQEAIRCYELAIEELQRHGMTHYVAITRGNLNRARRELDQLGGPS